MKKQTKHGFAGEIPTGRGLLSGFVRLNRNLSHWLRTRFPRLFEPPDSIAELNHELCIAISARKCPRILECGGIDRPLLKKSPAYRYHGLDIEIRSGCERLYDQFFVQSVEDELPGAYDLIISRTLIEHVPDNHRTWASIFDGLAPQGETIHYIPCKNHPYSIATRMVGNDLHRMLVRLLRPEHEEDTGYRTHFHLCTAKATLRELKRIGFTDVRIKCFWDAEDYFAFFVPAFLLVSLSNQLCRKFRWAACASGMVVYARKGEPKEGEDAHSSPLV